MMSTNELHVVFGTGPVGQAVMRELVAKDKPVRLVNRRGQADDSDFVQRFGNHATPLEKAVSLTVAWYREWEQSKAPTSRKGEQP